MKIKTSLLNNQASSFWLGQEFDLNFRENTASTVDYTKLAATQRAIGNFVNIVTGKQIPVIFKNSDSSYTDGKRVVIGTKLDGKNFDPACGSPRWGRAALHRCRWETPRRRSIPDIPTPG